VVKGGGHLAATFNKSVILAMIGRQPGDIRLSTPRILLKISAKHRPERFERDVRFAVADDPSLLKSLLAVSIRDF
jgi:hypothetical protein